MKRDVLLFYSIFVFLVIILSLFNFMGYTGMTGGSVLVSDVHSDRLYFIYSFSALFFIAFFLILIVDKEIQFRNNRQNCVSYCDESAKNRVIQIKL